MKGSVDMIASIPWERLERDWWTYLLLVWLIFLLDQVSADVVG